LSQSFSMESFSQVGSRPAQAGVVPLPALPVSTT